MITDRKTTSPLLRIPVLGVMIGFAVYFALCPTHTLGAGSAWIWEPARWEMFTLLDRHNHSLSAEARIGGEWKPIDLDALFPSRWESGLRCARCWKRPISSRTWAAATCGRHPEKPERVRFWRDTWSKTLGRKAQPKRDRAVVSILDWDCAKTVTLPAGRRL